MRALVLSLPLFDDIVGTRQNPMASKISALLMCRLLLRTSLPLSLLICRLACAQNSQWLSSDGSAPQAPKAAKRYPISGTVVNSVTSEPIRRALVRVNSGQEQLVAFTGADGSFQLASVPEGQAWISAQRPGYFDPQSTGGFRSPTNGARKVGSGSNEFRVLLTPESTVLGTVLDTEGEPIEDLQVQLLGEQIVNGRKQWITRGSVSTDDSGAYKLSEQMPGRVVVCTAAKPLIPNDPANGESYPPRCYPDGTDLASAQIIDLAPGQDARTDFKLGAVRAFSVSGVIVNLTGDNGTSVWAEGAAGMPAYQGNIQIDPRGGRFRMGSVPDGSWRLHFQSNMGQGKVSEAVETVVVSGSDVRGLQIRLTPGVDVPIQTNGAAPGANQTITTGGGTRIMPPSVTATPQLQLISTDSANAQQQYYSSFIGTPNGESSGTPSMAVLGVRPGSYNVFTQITGVGCLASIFYGGSDLSREPLTIAPGSVPLPITVNLRNDCASISVTVHSDPPASGGFVLVVPDSGLLQPQIVSLASDGLATVSNLSPGLYHAYAISDLEGLEYANPQAMRDLASATLDLQPSQKSSVTLELINRRHD